MGWRQYSQKAIKAVVSCHAGHLTVFDCTSVLLTMPLYCSPHPRSADHAYVLPTCTPSTAYHTLYCR